MAIKAYYKLNGNANDSSGNGNNGTSANITYSQANGIEVQGAGFNGSSSTIELPSGAYSCFNGSSSFTFSFWLRVTGFGGTSNIKYCVIQANAGKGSNGNQHGFLIVIYDNRGVVMIRADGSTNAWKGLGYNYEDNLWKYIVVVFNGLNYQWYYDSKLGENGSYSLTPLNPSYCNLGILWEWSTAYYKLTGSLENVIIDNSSWSAASVKNEYSRVKGFF